MRDTKMAAALEPEDIEILRQALDAALDKHSIGKGTRQSRHIARKLISLYSSGVRDLEKLAVLIEPDSNLYGTEHTATGARASDASVNWKLAPTKALWWAMDSDGRAHWYTMPDVKPPFCAIWSHEMLVAPAFAFDPANWRSSLVTRPGVETPLARQNERTLFSVTGEEDTCQDAAVVEMDK